MDEPRKRKDRKWLGQYDQDLHPPKILARSHPLTPPTEAITDDPKICLVANKQWWSHIAGVVDALTETRAWDGVDSEDSHAIQQILEFLEGVGCMDFQLRQSPTDPCILEQTLDGGDTWTPAFDFLACEDLGGAGATDALETNENFEQLQQDIQNSIDTFNANYVNSVGDLHPDLVYDGTQNDGDRDRALCYALEAYVDAICEAMIQIYREAAETTAEGMALLSLAAATFALVAIAATAGGALFAAAVLGAIGTSIGFGQAFANAIFVFANNHERDQFEDLTARAEVVCAIYDNLKGQDVDLLDFQSAWTETGLSANAQAIHDAGALFAEKDQFYAVFVDRLAYGYNASTLGLIAGCDCETDYSVWTHQFSDGLGIFELEVGTLQPDGVHGVKNGDPIAAILRLRTFHPMRIKEIAVGVERVDGIQNGQDDEDTALGWPEREQSSPPVSLIGFGFAPNGVYERCVTHGVVRDSLALQFRFEVSDFAPTSDIVIRYVRLVMEQPAPLGIVNAAHVLC